VCGEIGAPLEAADASIRRWFEKRLVEDVFVVQEPTFDAEKLAQLVLRELEISGIELLLETRVSGVERSKDGRLSTRIITDGGTSTLDSELVFNCAYSGISQVSRMPRDSSVCRHEIAELVLVEVPKELKAVGITVMDGPFFSLLPFPSRGLHTLSHVRHTPHLSFVDMSDDDPYERLSLYSKNSQFERMRRDAARYVPVLAQLERIESLFEVKTVLLQNENDDGRPILFQEDEELSKLYTVMGGKIDNVYDAITRLREIAFE